MEEKKQGMKEMDKERNVKLHLKSSYKQQCVVTRCDTINHPNQSFSSDEWQGILHKAIQ